MYSCMYRNVYEVIGIPKRHFFQVSLLLGIVMIAFIAPGPSTFAQSPGLGKPLSDAEVAQIDFTVMPDGAGLPDGAGHAIQGAVLYEKYCLACHGIGGEQGINDRLAGGHGSLVEAAPVKTIGSYWPYATTVFDFIRRSMPYNAPGTLSDDDVYALTAYLLNINNVIDESVVMNARTLPAVRMPNHENFRWAVK